MASTGTIIVNVFSSDAKLPVEGAAVIFRQQQNPYSLLGLRTTDSSGKTPPLTLETVSPSLSQSPETVIYPWTGIVIQVEHPEYEKLTLNGVQIFPDIITVQNVQLLPLPEHDPLMAGAQQLIITPQPVWEGPA